MVWGFLPLTQNYDMKKKYTDLGVFFNPFRYQSMNSSDESC